MRAPDSGRAAIVEAERGSQESRDRMDRVLR
jgi:hypothetical protein